MQRQGRSASSPAVTAAMCNIFPEPIQFKALANIHCKQSTIHSLFDSVPQSWLNKSKMFSAETCLPTFVLSNFNENQIAFLQHILLQSVRHKNIIALSMVQINFNLYTPSMSAFVFPLKIKRVHGHGIKCLKRKVLTSRNWKAGF